MGMAPLYSTFATDNRLINPWQSIRGHLIWSPLYLSNNLYCVDWRHKCSQHRPTQQGYLPVQVPEHWLRPESTQCGLILWYRVGTTSSPLIHDRFYQSLRAGGWDFFIFKRWNWSSWDKNLYKCRLTKIKSLACLISEHKIHFQEA